MSEDKQRVDDKAGENDDNEGRSMLFSGSYVLLWVLVLGLLVSNVMLIRELLFARQAAASAVGAAIEALDSFHDQTFSYVVVIDETIAIDMDMPINTSIPVVINEDFDINSSVSVPVDLGPLGTTNVNVPIRTTIPIDLTVEVVIDQTFPINAPMPLYLEVPLELAVEDTPFAGTLDEAGDGLQALYDELSAPLFGAVSVGE